MPNETGKINANKKFGPLPYRPCFGMTCTISFIEVQFLFWPIGSGGCKVWAIFVRFVLEFWIAIFQSLSKHTISALYITNTLWD